MALNEIVIPGKTALRGTKLITVPAGQTINIELNGADDTDMTWTNTTSGDIGIFVEMSGSY